jgi:hypothetical protein
MMDCVSLSLVDWKSDVDLCLMLEVVSNALMQQGDQYMNIQWNRRGERHLSPGFAGVEEVHHSIMAALRLLFACR